jgi:hypothetical protein
MLFPWYASMMLAAESIHVIGLRFTKLGFGGTAACDEAFRMVSEKIQAAREAQITLLGGGSADEVVARYREHVASNQKRLRRY